MRSSRRRTSCTRSRLSLSAGSISEVTWEDAQTWDVKIDQRRARDRIADAEAEAAIRTSVRTGLPPREAGELTMGELDVWDGIRDEQDRALAAATRARAGRRGRRRR